MTRFLLHIGANKTGTSSIQKMMVANREALLNAGWDYPDFHILHMAHHKLAYSISRNFDLGMSGDWEEEFFRLTRDKDKRFIFSSELFFRIVNPRDTARFFPPEETTVILYLRDQLSYMMSWYAQSVQERNLTASFPDFVKIFSQPMTGFLEQWEKVYGKNRIILRPFARSQLKGGDSRKDFLQFLDGVDAEKILLDKEVSNLSISGNLLFYKLLLNHYMSMQEATSYPIPDEFGGYAEVKESFNGKFFASAEEVYLVKHVFSQDIDALEGRGLRFSPMPREVKGHAVPNYDTLKDDVRTIRKIAIETDKKFMIYAERWQDWHSL